LSSVANNKVFYLERGVEKKCSTMLGMRCGHSNRTWCIPSASDKRHSNAEQITFIQRETFYLWNIHSTI